MLSKITFNEIQTTDLLFYDSDINDICFRFCQARDIDSLPSLKNSRKFYRKTDTGFSEDAVTEKRMAESWEFIFDATLLDRFRTTPLLFIYANKELTGVVHFCDYNRPAVSSYLFNLLSTYEKSLRKLLIQNQLTNQDVLTYFLKEIEITKNERRKNEFRANLANYEKKRAHYDKLPPFEMFYLKNLMELARDRKIINLKESVNDLRNMVMHSHELVNMQDATRDDYIYDFSSFEEFFKKVQDLLEDFKKVTNRVAFSEGQERI